MAVIPLDIFFSFKSKTSDKILLFNKKIKNNVKKHKNLKKFQSPISLVLNKINNENYEIHLKTFLKNNYLEDSSFENLTIEFFVKMLSDDKFMEYYLLFYKELLQAYYSKTKFDFSFLVNLVESKYLMDFENKKVLLENIIHKNIKIPSDLNDKEKNNYLQTYKNNNIKLIYYLIKNNIIQNNIIKNVIYPTLNKKDNISFLYEFQLLYKDYDYIKTLDLSEYDLRFQTLFKELLNEENIPKLFKVNKSKVKSELNDKEKPKISNKILIENIIEEYLFMEDIDEVKTFIDNHILKKNLQIKFVEIALEYGKKNDKIDEIKFMLQNVSPNLKKKPVKIQSL